MDTKSIKKSLNTCKDAGYILVQIKVCPKQGEVIKLLDGDLVLICKGGNFIRLPPSQVHRIEGVVGLLNFDRKTGKQSFDCGLGTEPTTER